MKKYTVPFICIFGSLLFIIYLSAKPVMYINDYPNLPAPIGQEAILFTTAGQVVEGEILGEIASNLRLEGDYRPRALASDLYDYKSLVIAVGYSPSGIANTLRTFEEEKERLNSLLIESDHQQIPVILVHMSDDYKGHARTLELLDLAIPYADYFLGFKDIVPQTNQMKVLRSNHVPFTLVNNIEEIKTPLNSAFR